MPNQKRYARGNAIKHGVFCRSLLAGSALGEEKEVLVELISDVSDFIRPTNRLEKIDVEKFAVLLLRQMRLNNADLSLAKKLFARIKDGLSADQPPPDLHLIDRENQVFVERKDPSFDSLIRYDTSLERQLGRIIDHLQQLRSLCKKVDETGQA
jgi:hypothetical protein